MKKLIMNKKILVTLLLMIKIAIDNILYMTAQICINAKVSAIIKSIRTHMYTQLYIYTRTRIYLILHRSVS